MGVYLRISGRTGRTTASKEDPHGRRRRPGSRCRRPHRRAAPATAAAQEQHRDGRDTEQPVELDPVEHLGRGGPDGQVGRRLPARARLCQAGHRLCPGQGRRPPSGRHRGRGRLPPGRRGRVHRAGPAGRVQHPPLRLPRQRHRPAAEVRRHRGARPAARAHRLGVHRRPRRRGRGPPRRDDRPAARRGVADPRHRHGPRHLHLRGRSLRVRLQRRPRAPAGRGPRPRPAHLPHERGRAR